MAEQLAGGIDRARLQVLEGTRHLSLLERLDIWPAITEFLRPCDGLAAP